MYDRAARFLDEKLKLNNVGPGTYDVQDVKSKKCHGYAPFSSLASRDSFLTIKEDGHNAFPGPGSYEPIIIFDHIKGASSLGNTSKRFDEKLSDTPGPGNYDVSLDIGSAKKEIPSIDAIKKQNILRLPDPPSIPCPGQAFGYEEGHDGRLRKQKAPAVDRSLGPAYYAVNHEETAPVQRYKGVHFGSMTEKRIGQVSSKNTPGPGAYSVHLPASSINSIILEDHKKKLVNAYLPRYHEIIPMAENKKAVPGPGKYEIKSDFEQTEPMYDANLRPSFGSQSKRFAKSKEVTPAPDAYDTRHVLETTMSANSNKRYPFSQSSRRFDTVNHATMTPAPDSYNITGLVDDLQKKVVLSSNLKGAFGSSAAREFAFKKKAEEMPGPLHYSVHSAPAAHNADKRNAVFKSSTRRLANPANNLPPPGSYNILRSFNNKHRGTLCKMPGKTIDGGFLSSTKRFSQPRDIVVKKVDGTTPGPGEYVVKSASAPAVSMVSNVERFKERESKVPGPGSYQLSPLLRHTVLKGTYNVTLNNPVESVLVEADDKPSQLSLTVTG